MNRNRQRKTSQKAAELIDNCQLEDMAQMNASWVAQKIKVNPSYLSRIFKEDYNCHLKDYIERAKMIKAKNLLETTEMPVKEIAARLDYSNPGYFSQKFRLHNGMSPSDCRKISHCPPQESSPLPLESERKQKEPLLKILKKRIHEFFKKLFQIKNFSR